MVAEGGVAQLQLDCAWIIGYAQAHVKRRPRTSQRQTPRGKREAAVVSVSAETTSKSQGGPSLTAEVLWSSALALLRERLSKSIFDTWVRDAEAIAYSGDTLVLGVGNSYAGEVLTVRLPGEIEAALAEVAGHPVRLLAQAEGAGNPDPDPRPSISRTPVTGPTTVPVPPPVAPGGTVGAEALTLESAYLSVYDELVRPERIIAVPRYYLRWIPYLGVDLAWIPIGFRQVAFLKGCAFEEGDEFEASSAEIALWSGLSRRSFWRKINDPLLRWFVRPVVPKSGVTWIREEDGTLKQLPGRWRVVMSMPLTPADQRQLRSWLRDRLREGLAPAHALQAALQTPIDQLLPWPIDVPEVADEPQGVEQVVRAVVHEAADTPTLKPLVQALAHHVAGYTDPMLVTHYFIRRWLPHLGAGAGWLVQYLRVLAAQTGQGGAVVTVSGGMPALAHRMGTSRKTIQRWLNDGVTTPFLAVEGHLRRTDHSIDLLVQVKQDEPLFDEDGQAAASHTRDHGQTGPPARLDPGQAGTPDAFKRGQVDTSGYLDHGQGDTPVAFVPGHSGIPGPDGRGQSDTPEGPAHGQGGTVKGGGGVILDLDSEQRESTTSYRGAELSGARQDDMPASAGEKWDLSALLRLARVHPARARQLAGASAEAWVSWLLYWASTQGAKLNEPIGNAVNRLSTDPRMGAGGAFDRLAALGPEELRDWVVPHVLSPYAAPFGDSRDGSWQVMRGIPTERLRQLAEYLGFDLSWEWEQEEAREEEVELAPGEDVE